MLDAQRNLETYNDLIKIYLLCFFVHILDRIGTVNILTIGL